MSTRPTGSRIGLALTGGHSTGSVLLGTAGGALAGSLLGHALQGSDTADRFVIARTDGSSFQVTTEPRDIEVGDDGQSLRIRLYEARNGDWSQPLRP